jgi:hypothetical protein
MDASISVTSYGNLGELRRGSFPVPAEAFFRSLVETPHEVVAMLIRRDLTIVRDVAIPVWEAEEARLVAALAAAPDKKSRDAIKLTIPAIAPARFAGFERTAASCLGRQVVGLDFDHAPGATFEDVVAHVRDLLPGLFVAMHTTATERNEDGTWRIRAYVLLDREATPAEWDSRVKPWMRTLGESDPNALDVARLLFLPVRTAGYRFAVLEGSRLPLDGLSVPALAPVPAAPKSAPRALLAPVRQIKVDAAAAMLGAAWPERGRHGAQLALAGALYRDGWDQGAALEFLCAVCDFAGDEDRPKREATIRRTWSEGEEGKNVTGWTRLEEHVPATIVSSVRDLLDVNAESLAEIMRELGAEPANDAEAPRPGLGFDYGGWEVEPPPVEFLVEGLFPKACVSIVFGRADSLKTWLLFDMAIAIAKGQPWLGRNTRESKVGIVDYETGKSNVARRLYMLRAGDCGGRLGRKSFAKLKPNDLAFWKELAREGFDIVIVDSLRRSNPGANENDSSEAIRPLELAAEFSEATGCAVVFIHHAKKSQQDGWPEFRGSAAIEDQVDVSFAVRKLDGPMPETKRVEIKCEKPGDMRMPEPFSVEVAFDDVAKTATLREVDGARPLREREVSDEDVRAAIKLALMEGPLPTKEKIRAATGMKRERIYVEIDVLKRRNEIVEIEGLGYALDDEAARTARVLEQVRASDQWRSAAKLANAAYVTTRFVQKLIRTRVIYQRVLGDDRGGFIVADRDDLDV